ncbi:hypothetical protein [Paenibacillus pini]|uniref:Uncharacterized protein n=1 Tax=Paenibacillus pini JCM 16418 TaxID=1236976 RepID=W7YI46_9BACL|nr:hypothetical protein [Paenibacillus pini]GAF07293.1 hypothetical protein JCM16418_1303 [Paenibacillus pini JCM 16418]
MSTVMTTKQKNKHKILQQRDLMLSSLVIFALRFGNAFYIHYETMLHKPQFLFRS